MYFALRVGIEKSLHITTLKFHKKGLFLHIQRGSCWIFQTQLHNGLVSLEKNIISSEIIVFNHSLCCGFNSGKFLINIINEQNQLRQNSIKKLPSNGCFIVGYAEVHSSIES